MNVSKVFKLYSIIQSRLPSTHTKLKLAFYEDEECMFVNNGLKVIKDEVTTAIVNTHTHTICFPLHTVSYFDEGDKPTLLTKLPDWELCFLLLHETAHMFFYDKYGPDEGHYDDESACNAFAIRWVKKLTKEGLI